MGPVPSVATERMSCPEVASIAALGHSFTMMSSLPSPSASSTTKLTSEAFGSVPVMPDWPGLTRFQARDDIPFTSQVFLPPSCQLKVVFGRQSVPAHCCTESSRERLVKALCLYESVYVQLIA